MPRSSLTELEAAQQSSHTMATFTATPTKMGHTDWQKVAQRKISDRERALSAHPEWRVRTKTLSVEMDIRQAYKTELSANEVAIVNCDATAVLERIHKGDLKCVDVTAAFCHAATVAQDLTNCLTEVFFDEAMEEAKKLDEYMVRAGKPVGPLHGLPVSIKDHIMVRGKDTATGYVAWCFKTVALNDAVAVEMLRRAGAILYTKTNNPQTLLVRLSTLQ